MNDKKYGLRQRQRNNTLSLLPVAGSKSNLTKAATNNNSKIVPSSSLNCGGTKKAQKVKLKCKPAPLSKYRRKTANARERTRMREINTAFETLRQCVPINNFNLSPISIEDNPDEDQDDDDDQFHSSSANEKLTKITTLRLAMNYIESLTQILSSSYSTSTASASASPTATSDNNNSNCQHDNRQLLFKPLSKNQKELPANNHNHNNVKKKSKFNSNKQKIHNEDADCNEMSCFKRIGGGLLESDGESLNFSDPCLSPLHQHHQQPEQHFNNNNTERFMNQIRLLEDDTTFGFGLGSDLQSLEIKKPFLNLLHDDDDEFLVIDKTTLSQYQTFSELFEQAPIELFLT